MRSLFAFSGGGGSGFPGSPVAGVYFPATSPEFLTVCAEVVAVPGSVVLDIAAGGVTWVSNGSQMDFLGGYVNDFLTLSGIVPGTVGGVTFQISTAASVYNFDSGSIYNWDGLAWVALN